MCLVTAWFYKLTVFGKNSKKISKHIRIHQQKFECNTLLHRYNDLRAILYFMYHGEVNIPHPGGFLAVTEDLRDNIGTWQCVYFIGTWQCVYFYAILYTSFYFNKIILISEAFRSIKLSICLVRQCAL